MTHEEIHGPFVQPIRTETGSGETHVTITRSPEDVRHAVLTTQRSTLQKVLEYLKILYR